MSLSGKRNGIPAKKRAKHIPAFLYNRSQPTLFIKYNFNAHKTWQWLHRSCSTYIHQNNKQYTPHMLISRQNIHKYDNITLIIWQCSNHPTFVLSFNPDSYIQELFVSHFDYCNYLLPHLLSRKIPLLLPYTMQTQLLSSLILAFWSNLYYLSLSIKVKPPVGNVVPAPWESSFI